MNNKNNKQSFGGAYIRRERTGRGTEKATVFSRPVNYFDEETGKMRPILRAAEEDAHGFNKPVGPFTASFSKLRCGKRVTVTNGSRALSWEYIPTVTENGEKKKRAAFSHRCEEDLREHFAYRNAESGVDISYTVNESGVKEDIIVKEKRESYRFSFALTATGLTPTSAENGKTLSFEDEKGEKLFSIPAPFMTDAAGVRSDSVFYELTEKNGEKVLTVVADEAFMNAPERVFPVTVDPCVVFAFNGTGSSTYLPFTVKYAETGADEELALPSLYISISKYPTYTERTFLTLSSLAPLFQNPGLKRAELLLTPHTVTPGATGGACPVRFYPQTQFARFEDYSCTSDAPLVIDLLRYKDLFLGACPDFVLDVIYEKESYAAQFYGEGTNAPRVELEYFADEDAALTKTALPTPKGTAAELDVWNGEAGVSFADGVAAHSPLDVTLSHIYRKNKGENGFGNGFGLNLDETLKRSNVEADYIYTDARGDEHGFYEYFYYTDGNTRVDVDKALVTTDTEGKLTYLGKEITRELRSSTGWEASAQLDGVKKLPLFEQRTEDEAQLEEQAESYKNALCQYVKVDMATGAFSEKLISEPVWSDYEGQKPQENEMLLPLSDAMSYRSLCLQRSTLNEQKISYELEGKSLENQKAIAEYQSISQQIQADNYSDEAMVNQKELDFLVTQKKYNIYMQKYNYAEIAGVLPDDAMLNFYVIDDAGEPDVGWLNGRSCLNGSVTINSKSDWLNLLNFLYEGQQYNYNNEKYTYLSRIYGRLKSPNSTKDTVYKVTQELEQCYTDQAKLISCEDSSVADFTKQLAKNKQITQYQLDLCEAQITEIQNKAEEYREAFQKLLVTYLRLKEKLETLKEQIPVAYMKKDGIVKGFNAEGSLVAIFDSYENVVAIERDESHRITRVYDSLGNEATLTYESGKLCELCDVYGNRVLYTYDANGFLTAVTYGGGATLTLTYDARGNMLSIAASGGNADETQTAFSYNAADKLTRVTHTSQKTYIGYGAAADGSVTLQDLSVSYGVKETTLTDTENQSAATYRFDERENLSEYYLVEKGLVAEAKKVVRDYESYASDTVYTAFGTALYAKSLAAFSFDAPTGIRREETTYNSFRQPVSKTAVIPTALGSKTETASYSYDAGHRLVKETVEEASVDSGILRTAVTAYTYDSFDRCIRKESYLAGEERTEGKTVSETVYGENGSVKESYLYNALDPASKFYTVSDRDDKGRVTAEYDATGKHKTTLAYAPDGTLRAKQFPNGATIAYGTSPDGKSTSVTASTEAGEENTNLTHYTAGEVTKLESGNNTVEYTYDGKRRVKSVSLNGVNNYVTYAYSGEHTDAEKVTATMADGTVATTTKNAYGNVTKSTCGDRTVTNTYDADRQLTKTVDSISGETTLVYDDTGNVLSVTASDHSEAFAYGAQDNTLDSKTITVNGVTHTYVYGYKSTADKALDSISVDGKTVRPNTDALGRNTGKTIEIGDTKITEEKISYIKFGDHATNMPSNVRFATNGVFNESIQYKYDSMGNIVESFENGRSACRYEYDSLGRLTREDNIAFGKTTTWAYDNNGNIIARYEYAITTKPTSELHLLNGTCKLYTYDDNSDQLTSYNGEAFEYDVIGNPTTYRGKAAVWEYGRQLKSYDGNTFTYDARGRRTAKNGITFTYDSNGNLMKQSNGLEFFYDHTGVFAVKYNGSTYYYRKNAQNDIIALLDNNGSVVVKYKYDAWGKCQTTVVDSTATTIAELNPFRYRSYCLDTETGLYFLKTRYYDPEIGRFMTIDDISYLDPESINGLNLYAYCFNNPIMYFDPFGNSIIASLIILGCFAIAGGIIGGFLGANAAKKQGLTGVHYAAEIVHSVFKGIVCGLAVGGAFLVFSAGIAAVIGHATIFAAGVQEVFALGSLAINSLSIFGPLFGIETEPVEYDPSTPYVPSPNVPYNHPSLK